MAGHAVHWFTLCLSLSGCVGTCTAGVEFPSRPIRIVVPNPPGGTVDIVARAVGQSMSRTLRQNVIVESKPGGNNIIGTEAVARAHPDGHTLLLAATHFAINPLLHKLPYDGVNAFSPVAGLASTPNVIAVHPSLPARSLRELIGLAQRKPGFLNCASANIGTSIHLAAIRFESLAKINMNYVPYQGGIQAAIAVVGGHADVLFAPLSDAVPHVVARRLRGLAVTSAKRVEIVNTIPTVDESGFAGFHAVQWFGAVAPAGTAKHVIERLSAAMLHAVENPELRDAFSRLGIASMPMTPDQFGNFVRNEMQSFAAIIREANIRVNS